VLVFTSVPYHSPGSTGVSAAEPGQSDRRWIRQVGVLSGVGLTLVISTVLGLAGGIVLDRWLGTAPWLMLVGLLLGIASGFVNLFRAAGIFGREGGQGEGDRSD
jgi:F0F1-type ATP synthase assembly protein I